MKSYPLVIVLIGTLVPATAQVNAPGAVQLGVGISPSLHATHFSNELQVGNASYVHSDNDAAVTVTFPIDVHYGLSERFSLGLCVEPGRYLDSAGTHPNSLFLVSVSPRFYALNNERSALLLHMDVGLNFLKIGEVPSGTKLYSDRYSGGFFRPGVAFQWYVSDRVGLGAGLQYGAHAFNWNSRDPNDSALELAKYSATLRTSGVVLQAGLKVKFR